MTTHLWIFLLIWQTFIFVNGYDGYSSCSRPMRTSKAYPDPPCNLQQQNWCTIPGSAYPWHAVRRFVRENQGLMRRMYGEQRHISVLRAEIESNDLDIFSNEELKLREHARRRYSNVGTSSNSINMIRDRISSQYYQTISNIRISAKIPQSMKPTSPTKPKFNSTILNVTVSISSSGNNYSETVTQGSVVTTLTTEPHYSTTNNNITEQKEYGTTTSFTVDEPTTFSTTNPSFVTYSPTTDTQIPTETTTTNFPSTVFEPTDATSVETTYTATTTTTTAATTATVKTTAKTTAEIVSAKTTETPVQQATDLTEKHSSNHQLFQDVKQETYIPPPHKLRGVNACPVKEEVVAPYWANNTRGEVLALLNLYPFEQYVHWEKCTHEHKQMYCREGCRCEQQYRLHRLLAYDPNNECRGIFSDWFKFPSCCLCKCYDLPAQFHITSRSPREENRQSPSGGSTDWYGMADGG